MYYEVANCYFWFRPVNLYVCWRQTRGDRSVAMAVVGQRPRMATAGSSRWSIIEMQDSSGGCSTLGAGRLIRTSQSCVCDNAITNSH